MVQLSRHFQMHLLFELWTLGVYIEIQFAISIIGARGKIRAANRKQTRVVLPFFVDPDPLGMESPVLLCVLMNEQIFFASFLCFFDQFILGNSVKIRNPTFKEPSVIKAIRLGFRREGIRGFFSKKRSY